MRCLLALALCLCPALSFAQAPPQVPAGKALRLQASDNQPQAKGYRCYVGDVRVAEVDLSARVNGVVTCQLPAQSVGSKVAAMSAFNDVEEGPKMTVAFEAIPPLTAPTNPVITVITTTAFRVHPDGSAELVRHDVKVEPAP